MDGTCTIYIIVHVHVGANAGLVCVISCCKFHQKYHREQKYAGTRMQLLDGYVGSGWYTYVTKHIVAANLDLHMSSNRGYGQVHVYLICVRVRV